MPTCRLLLAARRVYFYTILSSTDIITLRESIKGLDYNISLHLIILGRRSEFRMLIYEWS